jgi:hypothetical protein
MSIVSNIIAMEAMLRKGEPGRARANLYAARPGFGLLSPCYLASFSKRNVYCSPFDS